MTAGASERAGVELTFFSGPRRRWFSRVAGGLAAS
jgi:hypothetical protein